MRSDRLKWSAPKPAEIAQHGWLIETKTLSQTGKCFRRRVAPKNLLRDIPRQKLDSKEYYRRDDDDRQQTKKKPRQGKRSKRLHRIAAVGSKGGRSACGSDKMPMSRMHVEGSKEWIIFAYQNMGMGLCGGSPNYA